MTKTARDKLIVGVYFLVLFVLVLIQGQVLDFSNRSFVYSERCLTPRFRDEFLTLAEMLTRILFSVIKTSSRNSH